MRYTVALCILSGEEDLESVDRIVEKARDYVDHVLVSREPVYDFSKARNSLSSKIDADYLLWWDTDEDYPLEFLKNIKRLLEFSAALCYRFPRVNLPDYSGYPDYQVRLYRREECYWNRPVHEIVMHVSGKPADQIDCVTLNEYPITHFPGSLHKRLNRFQRNMHALAKARFPLEELLREVDDFVYEVKNRYDDQKCSKV